MTGEVQQAVAALVGSLPHELAGQGWDEQLGRQAADALADAGWLGVGLPESLGGEGGDLADVLEIVAAVAGAGWPSPAADLLLITNSVLAHAGLERPGRYAVVVPALGSASEGAISVAADAVPWAPWATLLLVVAAAGPDRATVSVVESARAHLHCRSALSGTPVADVRLDRAPACSTTTADASAACLLRLVRDLGALSRSVQARFALRRVLDLTVEYVRTRRQFGRPLSAFQAVQQHLAVLAGEVATAEAAVCAMTCRATMAAEVAGAPRLAAARVRVADAAGEVTRLAHQMHGAMGITREYELHRHTLGLLGWREEYGTGREWAAYLAAGAADAADLWSWLLDETCPIPSNPSSRRTPCPNR